MMLRIVAVLGLLCCAAPALGAGATTAPRDEPGSLENRLNGSWVMIMSLPVYLMHGGFGFFEAGMTRRKSVVATLMHNLMVLAVTVLVFWLFGFGLIFGKGPAWIGLHGFAPSLMLDPDPRFPMLASRPVALVVAFVFALSYADTPATLIAGTNAERLKLSGFVVLTLAVSGIIFPLLARWIIAGGFLATRPAPVFDSGAGFIQLCGGTCALAATLALGPRRGRFNADGSVNRIPSHSLPLVFLGAFILWIGFVSFNMGFALTVHRSEGLVLTNTVLGSMAGASGALVMVTLLKGKESLRAAIIGMLTACVGVTSAAAIVMPWAAIVIGVVAGLMAPLGISLWTKLGIDDATEYLTMNVLGGVLGMVVVGVFASPVIILQYGASPVAQPGLIYGGGAQLVSQLVAVVVIIGVSGATCGLLAVVLRAAGWLRISAEEEEMGSDRKSHGESGYCGFAWADESGTQPPANSERDQPPDDASSRFSQKTSANHVELAPLPRIK